MFKPLNLGHLVLLTAILFVSHFFSNSFVRICPPNLEWSSLRFYNSKNSYQESWWQGGSIPGCGGGRGGGVGGCYPAVLATFRSLAPTHRDKLEGAGGPRWQGEKGSIICSAIAAWDIFQNVTKSPPREESCWLEYFFIQIKSFGSHIKSPLRVR